MDQQQIIATRREFHEIDTDHNGFITFDEAIQWGMAQDQEVREVIERQIQQDRVWADGQVSFEEFLRYKKLTGYS
ncbi:EF-hand domain-containing protein [Nocardia sp. NPDC004860]|uniref:EF-hand domain-containing protein n=1 Tax=Nocardia sp. NPDC004860 TaxID=3154557 RepID=UPI0033A89987